MPRVRRAGSLRPLGPEKTELRAEYLFAAEALADPRFDLSNVVDFADLVMSEDAEICEVNQRGLRALPHGGGVLMPEEYRVHSLHEWIRAQLAHA
jgi:glycine betaine catabolism A